MSATFDFLSTLFLQVDLPNVLPRSVELQNTRTTQFYFFCALCLLLFAVRSLFAKDWIDLVEAFKSKALAKTKHIQGQFPFSISWIFLLLFSSGVIASLVMGLLHPDGYFHRCLFSYIEEEPLPSSLSVLFYYCGITFALIVIRLLWLGLFTFILPVRKELGLYIKTVAIYTIMLGIALFPIALIQAFGPAPLHPWIGWIALGIYAFFVIMRVFRGFSIAKPFMGIRKDYIFAYFCALEILPVLLIFKGLGAF